MDKDKQIEELTLLLLYLTSWEETEDVIEATLRSWKGYPFEVLNKLTDDDLIIDSKRAKSIYFTKEGERKARELVKKYLEQGDSSAST